MSLVAWESALNDLEHDLDRVESSLASGAEPEVGTPPASDLGPLPGELRLRASALQARLVQVELALAAALQRTRRSMALTERVDPRTEAPRLLDVRG